MILICSCMNVHSQTLAERLGFTRNDRILIINNDDAGMCHAANKATIEGMENGMISSATIMTPCPWYNEIASYAAANPSKSFGVHLTLTSEWKYYRWGTVAPRDKVPGLYDEQGYMWKGVTEIYVHASAEGEEIRTITHSAAKRIRELEFFTSNELKELIEKEGIVVISYRPLLELQRKETEHQ